MIDDKKIEEAARKNILFNHRTADVTLSGNDLEKFGKANFIQGAHWATNEFLKDLWHPASEEPKTGKRLLAKCRLDIVEYKDMMFLGTIPWNSKVESEGIICWLYIGDLLPKKGGDGK